MRSENPFSKQLKRKPHSVRHRFTLLHATTFGLALWFAAGAVYLTRRSEVRLVAPVQSLSRAVELSDRLAAAQDDLLRDAAIAGLRPGPVNPVESDGAQTIEKESQELEELTEQYAALPRSADQQHTLDAYRQSQSQMLNLVREGPSGDPNSPESREWLAALRQLDGPMHEQLGTLTQADVDSLKAASEWLRTSILYSYLFVGGFAAFAVLALVTSQREHQREIWKPFDDLRAMVERVRQGDLDVSAAIPNTIEFGSLVGAFLEMARELRDARELLEQKVRDRTASLEAAQRELVQAAKMSSLGQLVAGVAHEINNPLTSILGFSELVLSRPNLDSRVRAPIETVREESMRLKNLINNLNAFARRSPQQKVRLDLREILGQVYELRRYQLAANRIGLHYERPFEPVWIEADPEQLAQVIFNLMLNSEQAISSARDAGDIWISCGLDGDRAWATVRDNGPGIPAEHLDHVFEPFFTTRPAGKGSGLGLSISDGILHQHHGTIRVESAQGAGTAMHISLPAAPAPQVNAGEPLSADAASAHAQPGAPTGQRALVIDDEPMILSMLQEYLEHRGWTVTALRDPSEVGQMLEGTAYELVLCDMKMPGHSGLDVLKLLREARPDLVRKFVLMSGHVGDATAEGVERLDEIAILQKPFTLKKLGEVIALRTGAAGSARVN
ncbi:MAG: ATP-binding protein [Candidatus Acidiferrales bacterium]